MDKWSVLGDNDTSFKQVDYVKLFSYAKTNVVSSKVTSEIQSTLVISNSLISNNRLSRSENLVPA